MLEFEGWKCEWKWVGLVKKEEWEEVGGKGDWRLEIGDWRLEIGVECG